MPHPHVCRHCWRSFPTSETLRRHTSHTPACRKANLQRFQERFQIARQQNTPTRHLPFSASRAPDDARNAPNFPDGLGTAEEQLEAHGLAVSGPDEMDVDEATPPMEGSESARASRHQAESDFLYVRSFPPEKEAGKTYGSEKTPFERLREEQLAQSENIHSPFCDGEEWELARWLVQNVGHNQTEEFLRLPIVSGLEDYHA